MVRTDTWTTGHAPDVHVVTVQTMIDRNQKNRKVSWPGRQHTSALRSVVKARLTQQLFEAAAPWRCVEVAQQQHRRFRLSHEARELGQLVISQS